MSTTTTTGLLSLNVHEALTFDGTELCLHPDLFGGTTTINNDTTQQQQQQQQPYPRTSLTSADQLLSSITSDLNNSKLQVGDMVEIRVWDPLPNKGTGGAAAASSLILNSNNTVATSGAATIIRSYTATTSNDNSVTSEETREVVIGATTDASISDGDGTTSQHSTPKHMSEQQQAISSCNTAADDNASSTHQDSSNSTTVDFPSIPPQRTRTTTDSDMPMIRSGGGGATKPPLQRRTIPTTAATTLPLSNSKILRHHRDLSDMTVDTAYGVGTGTPLVLDASSHVDFPLSTLSGDVAVMNHYDTSHDAWTVQMTQTHSLRLSFVMLVTEKTLTSLKESARTQVSLLRQVADLYQLSSYDTVSIHKINKDDEEQALEAVSADFLTVTIKDQFISRSDMHFFQTNLLTGYWVYEGQRLREATRGFAATTREIRHHDKQALSGIVTESTTVTFRSRSARIIWLVQISSGLWEYASPYEREQKDETLCETYFDKWIAFVHRLFGKWKQLEVSHSLTVVFFSRSFRTANSSPINNDHHATTQPSMHEADLQQDVYGRCYHDHYRVVIESETGPDWDSLILRIKEAFVNYPSEVGWTLSSNKKGCERECWRPSTASQGNVLEAINVTLNLLQFHYLDRDLQRTGNSIVVISAGSGVFEVDKGLAGISYQRMMDNGIGSDVLSLGLPPLHIAPFFLYNSVYHSLDIEDDDLQEQFYEVPHWMHLSFVSNKSDESVFIDHLFEAEEPKEDRKPADPWAGLEIAANGFLLPRSRGTNNENEIPHSPLSQPMSFSARGNAAASPNRKAKTHLSKERELIEGRDFRDILEACRPRNAGVLPSALRAILEMQEVPENGSIQSGNSSCQNGLKEWGTLDFDSILGEGSARKDSRLSQSTIFDERFNPTHLSKSPPRNGPFVHHVGDTSTASSYSPSTSSQMSSGSFHGMSYDRPFSTHYGSPSLDALELQKCPSLEIEHAREAESAQHDREADLETTLRGLMRNHDIQVFANSPQKLVAKLEPVQRRDDANLGYLETYKSLSFQPGTQTHGTILQKRQSLGHTMSSPAAGGLGAALTQYKTISISSNVDSTPNSLHRINSVGRMHPGSRQTSRQHSVADFAAHKLSPLLLPPVLADTSDSLDRYYIDSNGTSPESTLERRYLQPNAFSRQTVTDTTVQTYYRLPGNDTHVSRNLARSPGLLGSASIADIRAEARRQEGSHDRMKPISTSPPLSKVFGSPPRDKTEQPERSRRDQVVIAKHRSSQRGRNPPVSRNNMNARKAKILNPFRQQDEVEVLAKKSHNRRRWSHVFPLGEVEFKRHSGPNWKSLTAPAALPVVIDYFPTQEEIDRHFTVSMYNITLSEFEQKNYSSNMDLLVEMVRQRITQDLQLVSEGYINANSYRRETLNNDGLVQRGRIVSNSDSPGMIRYFLSMGHHLQVLTYDPASADVIEVTRYNAKHAKKNSSFKYQYLSYCQETQSYSRVTQTFEKYGEEYNWNKVDRLISGGDDREMREGMRFKRVMFGILPDNFKADMAAESLYVAKFRRLLEYFEKLRSKNDSVTPLAIKFVTSDERIHAENVDRIESTPGLARNSMQRIYVQLRKDRGNVEWMEIAIDSTFDTTWSYRIMFSWLVASSGKIDTQVNMMQRRCVQYGLTLVPFPQISVSKNVFLNPFKAPAILTVQNKEHAKHLDRSFTNHDFIHDGVFHTDINAILECIEGRNDFDFETRWALPVPGRNFVHRTGTLFVRVLTDRNGLCLLVVLGNYRYLMAAKDPNLVVAHQNAFKSLTDCLDALGDAYTSIDQHYRGSHVEVASSSKSIPSDSMSEIPVTLDEPSEISSTAQTVLTLSEVSSNDGETTMNIKNDVTTDTAWRIAAASGDRIDAEASNKM